MFRDLKEYQEIAKIYADKVSKPENLEERRGSSSAQLAQNRKDAFKPATPPQKGAGGGVGNPTNTRGTGAGTVKPIVRGAQGRTKRPEVEKSKFPSTAEIRAANQGRSGGGNAGGSTDSGGTSQSTIKSVEQKPEVKTPDPKPMSTKDKFKSKFIKKDKGVGFVKRGTAVAQRPENKEKARLRSQEMAKKRIAAKKEGTASTPMSGKEKAQAMAKARIAAKKNAMEEFTPYDYVLEYLLSSEQAATIEEANYVMTEMDAETIQGIVEDQKKTLTEKPGDGYIGPKFLNIKNPVAKFINKMRDESPIGGNKRVDDTRKGSGDKKVGEKIYYGK